MKAYQDMNQEELSKNARITARALRVFNPGLSVDELIEGEKWTD